MTFLIVAFAGASAVVFATLMLAQRSLYSSAVCFLAVVLQAGVLLYASGARLLAVLLLLIYAGAVAALIVVAIQVAGGAAEVRGSRWSRLGLPWPLAAVGLLLPVCDGAILLLRAGAVRMPAAPPAGDLALGPALFGPYAAAAEAVALLMLFAALAVVRSPEEKS